MKKILLFIFTFLIVSCNKTEKQPERKINHRIEILNWNLSLPENFEKTDKEGYMEVIQNTYNDSTIIFEEQERMGLYFDEIKMPNSFFYDKENIQNTFHIIKSLNPTPNRILKEEFAKELHSSIRKTGKTKGYIYKPLENKFINNWLIKIKGEKTFTVGDYKQYNTIYFSSNFMAISVNVNKEMDFEKEITKKN